MSRTAQILREAARRIDSGEEKYSCTAVEHAAHRRVYPVPWDRSAAAIFYETFAPGGWFRVSDFQPVEYHDSAKSRQHRVMMLLLAAEVAESEGA